jgi:sodium/bile acid cotransporter 7
MNIGTKRIDGFVLALLAAACLAALVPWLGAVEGPLHPRLLNRAGVWLIYFAQGLLLSLAEFRHAGSAWRVHVLIQGLTFLGFPLLGIALLTLTRPWTGLDLGVGLLFLCALPSTVTSSVALTALARGHTSLAVVNAALSSMLGVVITPLWLTLALPVAARSAPLGPVFVDLALIMVLPLALGQLLRPWLGFWATQRRRAFGTLDRAIVVLLVFTALADSFHKRVWFEQGPRATLVAAFASIACLGLALWAALKLSSLMRLTNTDRSAVVFCSATKSLVTGVPLAQLLFGNDGHVGVILLPILVYHPLQLVVCSGLARKWGAAEG